MKKRKIDTCLTLFSVGLLTSQWAFSPVLLAEERHPAETVIDYSIHQIEVQSTESAQTGMTGDEGIVKIEESFEPAVESLRDPMADSKEADTDTVVSDEINTDILESPTDWGETALEETDVETPIDKQEEESTIEVPETQEAFPAPDNERNEEQEEELSDSSNPPDEQVDVGEEGTIIQETNPEQSDREKESTPPSISLPEEAVPPIIQQPSVLPSLQTGFYDGRTASNLSDSFRASEVSESTLLGFALPLLSTYEEEWQAALVYALIRQVGESVEKETSETWVEKLFAKLVKEKEWTTVQDVTEETRQPGDLILNASGEIEGIYLADGYQVHLGDLQGKEVEETEDAAKIIEIQHIPTEESVSVKRINQAKLTEYGQSLVQDYPAPYSFTVNQGTQSFIDTLAIDAQRLGQEYDVFASVLIAQAILESGSGTSGLSRQPYYNLFGIKGSYQGNSVVLPTMEDKGDGTLFEVQTAFRSYAGYQESMSDYIALLRGGITGNAAFYQDVWRSEAKNYLRATDALTGTYATDVTYNKKLNSLIAAYDLTQYDQITNTESGAFIQGIEQIPDEYRALMQFPAYNGQDYNHSGSYPVGQCTWYVFNRVHQLGGKVDDYMGNGGQWGMTGRRLGYTVSQTPKAGMVVSFTPGTAGSDSRYGHVAFVEAVGPNGILISEGNVVGGTTISYRVISNELARSNQVSYILPK